MADRRETYSTILQTSSNCHQQTPYRTTSQKFSLNHLLLEHGTVLPLLTLSARAGTAFGVVAYPAGESYCEMSWIVWLDINIVLDINGHTGNVPIVEYAPLSNVFMRLLIEDSGEGRSIWPTSNTK